MSYNKPNYISDSVDYIAEPPASIDVQLDNSSAKQFFVSADELTDNGSLEGKGSQPSEIKGRLPPGMARKPIPDKDISDWRMRYFARLWNEGVHVYDILDSVHGLSGSVHQIATKLRSDPSYIAGCYVRKSKNLQEEKRLSKRDVFHLADIADPAMHNVAKKWNAGVSVQEIAAELGVKSESIVGIVGKLRRNPHYSIKLKNERKKYDLDVISDPLMNAWAKLWNDGENYKILARHLKIRKSTIPQISEKLFSDPAYVYASTPPKSHVMGALQKNASLADGFTPAKKVVTQNDKIKSVRSAKMVSPTPQEIEEFKLLKQQRVANLRSAIAGSIALTMQFGEQESLRSNFANREEAESAFKRLGFCLSARHQGNGAHKVCRHPSGLSVSFKAEDLIDSFQISFGFLQLSAVPSSHRDLSASKGYKAHILVSGKPHLSRLAMYDFSVSAASIGKKLWEIQQSVESGMFGLCAYDENPHLMGPVRIISVLPDKLMRKNPVDFGIYLQRNGIKFKQPMAEKLPSMSGSLPDLPPKKIANVIALAIEGKVAINLMHTLHRKAYQHSSDIRPSKKEGQNIFAKMYGTSRVNIIPPKTGIQFNEIRAVEALKDAENNNVICIGITPLTIGDALHFAQSQRAAQNIDMIIGLHNCLTQTAVAHFLDVGFDDIKPLDEHPDVLAANIMAICRRPRFSERIERMGPLHVHWSGGDSDRKKIQRIMVHSDTADIRVPLTYKELALLEYLMIDRDRAHSRKALFNNIYANRYDDLPSQDIINVYMSHIRHKVDHCLVQAGFKPETEKLIRTEKGQGFMLNPKFSEIPMSCARGSEVTPFAAARSRVPTSLSTCHL